MGKRGTTLSSNYINWRRLLRSVRNNKSLFVDTEIKILYGAFFVVIFLGLLFSLAKGLGDSKNFLNLKEKNNDDSIRASTDHDKIRKKGKFDGLDKR